MSRFDNRKFAALLGLYVITLVILYIVGVTFIKLPETGVKYADMAVPFLLGAGFGSIITAFFHPPASKPPSDPPPEVKL